MIGSQHDRIKESDGIMRKQYDFIISSAKK